MSIRNLFDGIADGIRAARLHAELERLSDRSLADIGLTRQDIVRRAVEWTGRR